jgi:hypothetical protein
MKRSSLLTIVSVMVCGAAVYASAKGFTTLADFDIPPPNNLNGSYGAFAPSASELTYVTIETLDDGIKHGNDGSSMRLDYNVEKGGSFNGFWMKLGPEEIGNNFDASQFGTLSFWIKGDPKVGVPKQVKVELKGDPGTRIGRQYIKNITADWKKITLPLDKYASQGVDLSKLNEMVIVFENSVASPGTQGRIWIDHIALEE